MVQAGAVTALQLPSSVACNCASVLVSKVGQSELSSQLARMGKNTAVPAGRVTLRVAVMLPGAPARNCTGPAIGPLVRLVTSVDCDKFHCHHFAAQSA